MFTRNACAFPPPSMLDNNQIFNELMLTHRLLRYRCGHPEIGAKAKRGRAWRWLCVHRRGTMKRIVICCDGTWKRMDAAHPTNVVKLAQAVLPRGVDEIAQVVLHLDGVGTGRGTGRVSRTLDRGLGGMFGIGLMGAIESAYRFLILNYAPGDEVYLLGFSRGAFTARSLAGLIRNCGILTREHVAQTEQAFALYRSRRSGHHPDGERALAFRTRYATRGDDDQGQSVRIRYLGVWDTVGALGVPAPVTLARICNRGFGFHDTRLSGLVHSARHAVAIDERRLTFPPALWDNLAELCRRCGDPARYQQRWFPGDHASVGGGGDVTVLSNDACLWIAEGAVAAGLAMDARLLAGLVRESDCRGPLRASVPKRRDALATAVLSWRRADREGPSSPDDLAPSALRRWRSDPSYRPGTLARVGMALEAGPLRKGG